MTSLSPCTTTIIIQPQLSKTELKSNKVIFRLGWISFILGACAFVIHYISLDRLENFSPINAGIISGFFLMIAGLASMAAGYRESSYEYFVHAQIWSFLVNLVLSPGLIAVAIVALVNDFHDFRPICQPTTSLSRTLSTVNEFRAQPTNIPCLQIKSLFNLSQILNTIQLIIGTLSFSIHMILISHQRKMIKQFQAKQNNDNNDNGIIFRSQSGPITTDCVATDADKPPDYEDIPIMNTNSSNKH